MSCAISPDCDHLSSSDNVVAWSGVQWDDVAGGVTILCIMVDAGFASAPKQR